MERRFLRRLLLVNDPYIDLANRVRRDRGLMIAPRDTRRPPGMTRRSTEEEQRRDRRRTAEAEDDKRVKERVTIEFGAEVSSLLGHLRLSEHGMSTQFCAEPARSKSPGAQLPVSDRKSQHSCDVARRFDKMRYTYKDS